MDNKERIYGVAETARKLGVADNTIRNYANKEEIQHLLSDRATLQGKHINAKGRSFTRKDILIFNTLVKRVTSATDWKQLARDIENGDIESQLDSESLATLAPDDPDYLPNLLEQRAQIMVLTNELERAKAESESYRQQRENDIKAIAVLEYRLNEALDKLKQLKGNTDDK